MLYPPPAVASARAFVETVPELRQTNKSIGDPLVALSSSAAAYEGALSVVEVQCA